MPLGEEGGKCDVIRNIYLVSALVPAQSSEVPWSFPGDGNIFVLMRRLWVGSGTASRWVWSPGPGLGVWDFQPHPDPPRRGEGWGVS